MVNRKPNLGGHVKPNPLCCNFARAAGSCMKTRDTRNFGTKHTGSRSGVVHRNTAQHLIGLVNPRTLLSPRNVNPLLSSCARLSSSARVSSRRVSLSHRNISTHRNISNSRHVTRDALALPLLVPHNEVSCLSSCRILPPSKPSGGGVRHG